MDVTPHFRGGEGEPLVLIHGFSATWRAWEPVLPTLTAHHDVLAATLPGHHGGPPLGAGMEVTFDAVVDGMERQMGDAGFDSAHLAGNSLGGWIALELARRGRARSVVGLAPAGGWDSDGPEPRRLRRLFTQMHRASSTGRRWEEAIARRPRLRKLAFRDVVRHGDRMSPDAALASMRGLLGCSIYWEFIAAVERDGAPTWLAEVDVPVLIAWPEHDRILREAGCSPGFRAIPGAQWTTLPDCGHVPMFDDPGLVARTILDFTSAVERGDGPSAPARRSAPAGSST